MRALLPRILPLLGLLVFGLSNEPVRAQPTLLPFPTIYADFPLDARVPASFPGQLRGLVGNLGGMGASFVSIRVNPQQLRVIFRLADGATFDSAAPFLQALNQSGLVSVAGPVTLALGNFGPGYTNLAEVSDDQLRGIVQVTPAPFPPSATLEAHTPGLIIITPSTFSLAGPNRAGTLAAIAADAALLGLTITPYAAVPGDDPYRYLFASFDANRKSLIEQVRRVRALSWVESASLNTFFYPLVALPPVTRHWLVSGRANRPGAAVETFLVTTLSGMGGVGDTLQQYLASHAFVPLQVQISPRTGDDVSVPGLERYALPWVARSVTAVGLADFGVSGAENLRNTPPYAAAPSDISADVAGWISANGNLLWTQNFRVVAEITPGSDSALANVSARAQVGRGERIVIGGFQVKGGSTRTLVIRATGPSLSAFGVANPLANPKLKVLSREGDLVVENDDWQTGARAEELVARYPQYAPNDPREAALLTTFYPGTYTVQLSGVGEAEGVAVFELFDAPEQP